MTGIDKVFIM